MKISKKETSSDSTSKLSEAIDKKEQQNTNPNTKKKFRCFCCGTSILLFSCLLIFLIGFVIASGYFTKIEKQNSLPTNLAPAFFLNSTPPDYTITEAEEAEMDSLLQQYFNNKKLDNVNKLLAKLKQGYPEGYYVVAKEVLLRPKEFKDMYDTFAASTFAPEEVLPHEFSHVLGLYCGTHLIEDKCITIQNYCKLADKLFSGDKILPYIEDQNFFDQEYLVKNKQNIITNLDEVNAYIKSVRADRIFKHYNTNPSTLARQMYYIGLQLKYAKEKDIENWNLLISNKGFAYTLMRVMSIAEAELETAKEEGFSGIDVTANLKLYKENTNYINEFLVSSGVDELKDLDLSYSELQDRGVDFDLKIF